jgi:hypothetical protein
MDAKEQRGRLAQWAMKLQPYEFKIMYQPGAKHDNADAMTRPPIVADEDIVSVVGESRARRAAAEKGREFIRRVATDPYGDKAKALEQHQRIQTAKTGRPEVPTPALREDSTYTEELLAEWPLNEDWEQSWPQEEDWFNKSRAQPTDGEHDRSAGLRVREESSMEGAHG